MLFILGRDFNIFQLRQVFGFPCHEVGKPPGGCWHSGASVVAGMAAMAMVTDLGVISTIRLVMQDFATIHSIIGIHRMYNHMFAQQSRDWV